MALGDFGAKHALLLAGIGWGSMPAAMVQADLEAGRLPRLDLPDYGRDGPRPCRCSVSRPYRQLVDAAVRRLSLKFKCAASRYRSFGNDQASRGGQAIDRRSGDAPESAGVLV